MKKIYRVTAAAIRSQVQRDQNGRDVENEKNKIILETVQALICEYEQLDAAFKDEKFLAACGFSC